MKKQLFTEPGVASFPPLTAALHVAGLTATLVDAKTTIIEGPAAKVNALKQFMDLNVLPYGFIRTVPAYDVFQGCTIKEDVKLENVYTVLGKKFNSNAAARQYVVATFKTVKF